MEVIFNRRSVRKYKDQPVEKEKIEKLLRAAMQAPSAGNQQPWEFIVVQDKENLRQLSEASQYSKLVANSPVAFVLLANGSELRFPGNWEQDMGAAAENILLEAVELGLGGVWIGIAPEEDRMNYVKKMFNLNDNLKPFCIISIGYPDGQENKFVDRFDESRIHYEKY
jgi:nitroreductase